MCVWVLRARAGNNASNNGKGIVISSCSNTIVSGNNITNNEAGIYFIDGSSNNVLTGNNVSSNNWAGVILKSSSNNNTLTDNIVVSNGASGFHFLHSNNNTLTGNNVFSNSGDGILLWESSNNFIYHNNFVDNAKQVDSHNSTNVWDDGAGKGNYWSDYEKKYPDAEEIDESGIWDTPYEIDENNIDRYPIVPEFPTWTPMLLILKVLAIVGAIYKRRLLKTPIH